MRQIFVRSRRLLGDADFEKILHSKVAIFGLGGVGGTALEALARTGIENFILCDFDVVDYSNLNRQILYTLKDVGNLKVGCAKEHILAINNEAKIDVINEKVSEEMNFEFLKDVDFVIDCIDDVKGKLAIAKASEKYNKPLIMSMGMANKVDISKLHLTRLNKTEYDPLAKKIRHLFKEEGININKINVVASKEEPKKDGTSLNSIMTVPSGAGLFICQFVISYLINPDNYL